MIKTMSYFLKHRFCNILFYAFCLAASVILFLVFGGILQELVDGSKLSFERFGLGFLINSIWDPANQRFGALGCIIGTLLTSLIALCIAVPVSFGLVIFNTFIVPQRFRKCIRVFIDLLAGIPSIVFGMWGLFVLAPIVGTMIHPWIFAKIGHIPWLSHLLLGSSFGVGIFTAGVVLAVMITPFIASIFYDVFDIVPSMLQESSYALGATVWETIRFIIIPYGKLGLMGGVMIGLGRALGETMAVSFVIGNAHTLTTALFEPANSITSALANEFTESYDSIYSSALIELGLILFLMSAVVVMLSQLLIKLAIKKVDFY
jgi:phosphate transport system permease protein